MFSALWLAVAAAVSAEPAAPATPAVVTLTDKNFASLVQPEELWLVKFYAPWCGHCKRLAPVLEAVAAADAAGSYGKVDCTVDKATCDKFGVRGFPTVLALQHGAQWEHRGRRNEDGLRELVGRMRKPAVAVLGTAAELEALYESHSRVVFLLWQPGAAAGGTAADAFDTVARRLKHKDTFASTSAPELARLAGVPASAAAPLVLRLERGEAPQLAAVAEGEAKLSEASLEAFVAANRVPTFSLIEESSFGMLANSGRPLVALLLDPTAFCAADAPCPNRTLALADAAHGAGAALRELSREPAYGARYVFGLLDAIAFEEHIADLYHVARHTTPRLVVIDQTTSTRFFSVSEAGTLGGAEAAGAMRAFLDDVASGAARREYEGLWGTPDRTWVRAKVYFPHLLGLEALERLPRYTFVALLGLPLLYALLRLVLWQPGGGDVFDGQPLGAPRDRRGNRVHKRD